jgi:hypothetical protein
MRFFSRRPELAWLPFSYLPGDSLAPARSALSGPVPLAHSFRRFPSNSSPPIPFGTFYITRVK